MTHNILAFEMPSAATVISVAVAIVLVYKGVLENLIASYSGLATARKEALNQEKEEHEKTKSKLKLVEEAYALALVEVDTSRRIRIEHNQKIKHLESDLALSRGLQPPTDVHRTES